MRPRKLVELFPSSRHTYLSNDRVYPVLRYLFERPYACSHSTQYVVACFSVETGFETTSSWDKGC